MTRMEDTLVEEDIRPEYVSAGETHVGRVRTMNQDAYAQWSEAGLWVVADGMGGYRDGDVAARMVCGALAGLDPALSLDAALEEVRARINVVNASLYEAARRPVNPVVSGSTVAALVARRTSCAVLWAGDSRVYRLRHGQLARLTTDHTWASELNIAPRDREDHAITRAVGGERLLMLDVRRDRVQLGDRYLLCSDGLTHELTDEQIGALLGADDSRECAQALISATLHTGARDNVTVVIVDAQ